MDKVPFRNLQILNELSKNHPITQREMAKNLNIALGLANTYLKRLVRKGHIMVKAMPGNRIIYNLTPKGIAEKAGLTYEYMKYSFEYYKDIRMKFKEVFSEIEKNRIRKIVFYGAGEVAEVAYISLNGLNLDLLFLVDDHKSGKKFLDKYVYTKEKLLQTEFDKVIITAFESRAVIRGEILKMNFPEKKIVYIQ